MHGQSLFPWMTRREAAEYLRWKLHEVDNRLVPLSGNPAPVRGKLRYLLMEVDGALSVRILAADVLAVFPLPQQPTVPAGQMDLVRDW